VTVPAGGRTTVTISGASGEIQAESKNTAVVTVALSNRTRTGATLTLYGKSAGTATVYVRDQKTTNVALPVSVVNSTSTATARYTLIAWNDLGMHCMDGVDYSVFSILPPYNNLNAQLVNASTGKTVTSGVTLTYEAVADSSGSINTSSAGKTNFWTWVRTIYGASPAANVGLTGNMTPTLTRAQWRSTPATAGSSHWHSDHALRRPGCQEFLSDGQGRRSRQHWQGACHHVDRAARQ